MARKTAALPSPHPADTRQIDVTSIVVGEQQLRMDLDDEGLHELANDIRARGLLQAIGVKPTPGGGYQLLYGSRRLAAHQIIGAAAILARIYPPDTDTRTTALVENLHRTQLSLAEEIAAVNHLHATEEHSIEQICSMLTKSRNWVCRRLSIPQMPAWIQRALLSGELGISAAEELCRIDPPELAEEVGRQAIRDRLTIPEIRATRAMLEQYAQPPPNVQAAITAGLSAPPPPPVFLECAACHEKREPRDLTIVRICAAGCAQHADSAH